jgi:hypothetical protein
VPPAARARDAGLRRAPVRRRGLRGRRRRVDTSPAPRRVLTALCRSVNGSPPRAPEPRRGAPHDKEDS